MLAPILDVFVGNAFIIDWEIFQFWLLGYECDAAVDCLQRNFFKSGNNVSTGSTGRLSDTYLASLSTGELLKADVYHQYRDLAALERLLPTPLQLQEQRILQLPFTECARVIEMYYELDDAVMRELLGKKPSSKLRKDLDEVAEKACVQLKSCRRQFDNVRRVYKVVDEISGDVVAHIRCHFLLSEQLARRYAVVVLFAAHRFEVHKRRMAPLSFGAIYACGEAVLLHWSDDQAELDREFLLQLRDLKPLLDREKEARSVVLSRLSHCDMSTESRGDLQQNFRTFFRSLVTIATSMSSQRSFREFFLNVFDMLEPCRSSHWSSADITHCLEALNFKPTDLETFNRDHNCWLLWQRFMRVTSVCLQQLFVK